MKKDLPGASSAAERLRAARGDVLERWSQRVSSEVRGASGFRRPILINTLPAFLEFLSQALSHEHPRLLATDGNSFAEEHGGERARLSGYRPDDLIREYQLLRDVMLETLGEETLTPHERSILLRSIDSAMTEACTAYYLVSNEVREDLAAALTHDLRGPISAAKMNALHLARMEGSEEVAVAARRIAEAMDRADRMLRDLLDASRLRIGQRLPLTAQEGDVVAVVRAAVDHLVMVHGPRFRVESPESVRGFFSPDALRRALENVGENAVKYGAPDAAISVRVCPGDGRVAISIHNEGSYIPAEEQGRLFQAFSRAGSAERSGQQGWGIGLSLVRGVLESHGGSVAVDSFPEKGTTFILDFPLDARPFIDVAAPVV